MSADTRGFDRRTLLTRGTALGAASVAGAAALTSCGGDTANTIQNHPELVELTGGDDYTPGSAALKIERGKEIDGINYPKGYVGPKAEELEPFGDGETEFTMLAQIDPGTDMATNYYSKLVEEKTGVKVKYLTVPSGDDGATKVNAIMAAGDLPHALMVGQDIFELSQVCIYGDQGQFLPLDKLIDEYAPHVVDMFNSFPEMRNQYSSPSGKLYAIPSMNDCFHCKAAAARVWINSSWLEGVGVDHPQSLDEFEDLMDAFRDYKDKPDGAVMTTAGADNFTTLFQFFLGSFLDIPDKWTRLNDGKIEFVQQAEGFREGLSWIKSQFDKGNFDRRMFQNTADQYQKLGDAEGGPKFGVCFGYSTGDFTASGEYVDPTSAAVIMKPLAPMAGPKGVRTAAWDWYNYGYPNFVVTPSCPDPVQMVRWADHQFELECSIAVGRGEKGIGWDYADKGVKGISGEQAVYEILPDGSDLKNQQWIEMGPFYKSMDERHGEAELKDAPSQEPILYHAAKLYEPYAADKKYSIPPLVYSVDASAEQGEIATNLDNAFQQALAGFCIGSKDPAKDADWNAYMDQCKDIGIERFIELQQAAYDSKYGA
jgi:putative aldouronate transport system substrate-binding protein